MGSDFVPEPRIVDYGCRPWEPSRELIHAVKAPNGSYKASKPKGPCKHCRGKPWVAGDMCPGCNGMRYWAETKLARQRARSAAALARRAKFRPKLPTAKKRREKAA